MSSLQSWILSHTLEEKKKKRKKSQIPFFICFLSFGYTLLPDFPRKARELKPQCLFQMEPDILKQEPPGALPRKTIAFPLPPTLLILGASSELHRAPAPSRVCKARGPRSCCRLCCCWCCCCKKKAVPKDDTGEKTLLGLAGAGCGTTSLVHPTPGSP